MATIHYRTLSMDLKKAIVNKYLTEDQLKETSERMKEDNRKYVKRINVIVIVVAVIFVIMSIQPMMNIGDPKFIVMMIGIIIGSLALVYVLSYFAMVGIVKCQYNSAVKKYYPEIADEVKI